MTTLIKIGIAAACLVGVAGLIAWDMMTGGRKADVPATPPPATLIVEPVIPIVTLAKVEEPVKPVAAPKVEEQPKKVEPAPVEKPAPKPLALETLPGGQKVYTVVQGDTLYGISIKVFGTPRHYERIYEANKERIDDPNTLQIGMKLTMPDVSPKPAAVGAATPAPAPAPLASAAPQDVR